MGFGGIFLEAWTLGVLPTPPPWCFCFGHLVPWNAEVFWCQHKVDHTPHLLPSWHTLVGFVTSYIMQNYFCTNCLKVIYARFECIPVFLLFWDCQLSWFPSGRRELNLYFINTKNSSANVPRSDKVGQDLPLKSMFNWKSSLLDMSRSYTSMVWTDVNYRLSKTLCQVSSVENSPFSRNFTIQTSAFALRRVLLQHELCTLHRSNLYRESRSRINAPTQPLFLFSSPLKWVEFSFRFVTWLFPSCNVLHS